MTLIGLGRTKPNQIDTVSVPGYVGTMGLVAGPGVRINANSVGLRRNIQADLQEYRDWGANLVVTFLEPHELGVLRIDDLQERISTLGIRWIHLPIRDMDIPDQDFEDAWAYDGERIRHALRIGERVILHCYAGLGRTGMIAARLLIELGTDPEDAIRSVRRDNRRRIQTDEQEAFVYTCYPLE